MMSDNKSLPPSPQNQISRRDFLKLSAIGLGGLAYGEHIIDPEGISALNRSPRYLVLQDFPQAERLGRVCVGKVEIKNRPHDDADTVKVLYEDAVVPWLHETVGTWAWRNNQRWVETPDGYIWSPYIQPVKNEPNQPITQLPAADNDQPGMWVEVSVPWVDAVLANPPARSFWIKSREEHGLPPRMYYSQILWIDQIKTDENGQVLYRINERYGNPGDIFWAAGEAFRPLTSEELTPISPDVVDKSILVNVNWNIQTLTCFEGNTEVYFTRISSGVTSGSTPITPFGGQGFPIWRKMHSVHMAGGTNANGWDLIGIGWTELFVGEGVAIHSTFWHNNFGEPMSHGCINASPQDAKWLFRWTQPPAPFVAGDITISGDGSTRITVIEE
jgi:hypothetical protein